MNVLSTIIEIRDYIKADGTTGQSSYYSIEFTNCDGNLPQNQDYDPNKPCADCDGGNPLRNMELLLQELVEKKAELLGVLEMERYVMEQLVESGTMG